MPPLPPRSNDFLQYLSARRLEGGGGRTLCLRATPKLLIYLFHPILHLQLHLFPAFTSDSTFTFHRSRDLDLDLDLDFKIDLDLNP
jgi:hypothetical protein